MLCRLTTKVLTDKEPQYSSAIDSFIATSLVVAGNLDYFHFIFDPLYVFTKRGKITISHHHSCRHKTDTNVQRYFEQKNIVCFSQILRFQLFWWILQSCACNRVEMGLSWTFTYGIWNCLLACGFNWCYCFNLCLPNYQKHRRNQGKDGIRIHLCKTIQNAQNQRTTLQKENHTSGYFQTSTDPL